MCGYICKSCGQAPLSQPQPLPLPLLQLSFNIKHAINARFSFRKYVKNVQQKWGKKNSTAQCRNVFFSCPNCVWEPSEALPINCIPNTFIVLQHKVKELRVPREGGRKRGRGIFTSVNNPSTEGGGSLGTDYFRERNVCVCFAFFPNRDTKY